MRASPRWVWVAGAGAIDGAVAALPRLRQDQVEQPFRGVGELKEFVEVAHAIGLPIGQLARRKNDISATAANVDAFAFEQAFAGRHVAFVAPFEQQMVATARSQVLVRLWNAAIFRGESQPGFEAVGLVCRLGRVDIDGEATGDRSHRDANERARPAGPPRPNDGRVGRGILELREG